MKGLALLFIDLQEVFMGTIPSSDSFFKRCSFAYESASLLGIPCVYTEQNPEKLGPTCASLLDLGFKGLPRFSKSHFSALKAQGVKEWFDENEVEHLLISGFDTSICVYQTVKDACAEGLGVTVLSDCIAGRREKDAQVVAGAFQKMQCHRLPSETVFYSILESSEHPQFREFTELVKKYS